MAMTNNKAEQKFLLCDSCPAIPDRILNRDSLSFNDMPRGKAGDIGASGIRAKKTRS